MSQNTSENPAKKIGFDNIYFKHILICKCGEFHEFYLKYEKEYFVSFPCGQFELNKYDENEDFSKKCKDCKKQIVIDKDFYKAKKTKTKFLCSNCYRKINDEKNKFKKISSIITMKDDDEDSRVEILDKFSNFIKSNGKYDNSEFYNKNLEQLELVKNFICYLCVLRKLFKEGNSMYKIVSNFLEYANCLIDEASNNIQIYDIYHFNKECIIYSYENNEERFLSEQFKKKYSSLLKK